MTKKKLQSSSSWRTPGGLDAQGPRPRPQTRDGPRPSARRREGPTAAHGTVPGGVRGTRLCKRRACRAEFFRLNVHLVNAQCVCEERDLPLTYLWVHTATGKELRTKPAAHAHLLGGWSQTYRERQLGRRVSAPGAWLARGAHRTRPPAPFHAEVGWFGTELDAARVRLRKTDRWKPWD